MANVLEKRKQYSPLIVVALFGVFVLLALPSFVSFDSFAAGQPAFSIPVNLSNDVGTAKFPAVANVASNIYVVWTEQSRGIFFTRSIDGGVSWSTPVKLNSMKGVSNFPVITANGTNVYVAWTQTINKILQVFFAGSTTSGATFSTAVQLSPGSNGAITPVIAGWGNNVYVAWGDRTTQNGWLITSNNAGVSWNAPFDFAPNNPGHEPQLAAYNQYVYAISNSNFVVSSNFGVSWTDVTSSSGSGSEPWVAAYGTNVFGAFETKGQTGQIFLSGSTDNGNTFPVQQQIGSSIKDSWAPMLNTLGNNVYVAFHNHPNSTRSQEYITISNNAGSTWSTPVSLSGSGFQVGWPYNVAISGSNAFVMWDQKLAANQWVVRVAYSADNGVTWTPVPGILVSNNLPGTNAAPQNDIATGALTAFGAHAYVVWEQTTATTSQIFFSSS
jgi:hypothetical protein